ncbi:hypothetical protein [Mycolicibacterium sp. 050158]|uniref:hypothetical protein n=1 Tax=Mycolicibacterium sp. 050158 TaxID=3090602 RepID=UPI00299E7EB1|nr:hypothetical protein [Mycolicibacterium sp. 050158]MDX1890120.1 hypothetical protein [Mycolicibacterium sp. 050158]
MTTRRVIFPEPGFWTRNQPPKGITMTNPPIGNPDNPLTKRASVDAVLLAQAFLRDDDTGAGVIMKNSDPYSVALQLCGFLFATFRQFDVDPEERLAIWLDATREQTGEAEQ